MFRRKSEDLDGSSAQQQASTSESNSRRTSGSKGLFARFTQAAPEKDLLNGMPPIIKAIYTKDDKRFSELLVKKKIDLCEVDKLMQRNVVHWSAVSGNVSQCQAILNSLNLRDNKLTRKLTQALDREGRSSVFLATIHSRPEILARLLRMTTDQINLMDSHGKSCLEYAVDNGDGACVLILIEKGANANIKTVDGCPLLISAINHGHELVAKHLIAAKVDLNAADTQEM
jgi:ankyrin repeat protein